MKILFNLLIEPMLTFINFIDLKMIIAICIILTVLCVDSYIKYGIDGMAYVLITEVIIFWFSGVFIGLFEIEDKP